MNVNNLPLELFLPILGYLDRRDLVNTSLVNLTFNRISIPLLYRILDSRITVEKVLLHPCTTLLRRPELAQYVRKVTETGTVQHLRRVDPRIIQNITAALRLCTNLTSARYIDDTDTPSFNFLPILRILITLPLEELVIRTHHDVGDEAWALLNKTKGIRRLSVWSVNSGPPRVLQGWADELGSTLTDLDLGRCAGVPPTILISVFSKLPLVRRLKLKGAPSAAIPAIMGSLPNLISLDTEYLGSGNYRVPSTPLPALEQLTVQAGSIDVLGPDRLWTWIRSLLPHAGMLKSFTLKSFPVYGRVAVPWPFIIFLTSKQGLSLKELVVGAALLNLDSVAQLCLKCTALETIRCTVASPDVDSIAKAISSGCSLRALGLNVMWIEDGVVGPLASEFSADFAEDSDDAEHCSSPLDHPLAYGKGREVTFTKEEARSMMLRPGSKLRAVRLGDFAYMGQWVLAGVDLTQPKDDMTEGHMTFEVVSESLNPFDDGIGAGSRFWH